MSPLSGHHNVKVDVFLKIKGQVVFTDAYFGTEMVDIGYYPKSDSWKFTSPSGKPNTRDHIYLKDKDGKYYDTKRSFFFEPGLNISNVRY
jgi:hypothetical protein